MGSDGVPLATLVWLALLVVLALLFVVTLRRMSALVARTRSLERFQRGVESVDRRFSACIVPLVRTLDETRRSPQDPTSLQGTVAEAQDLLSALDDELRGLGSPEPLAPAAGILVGELERAMRAASLVEHGLVSLVGTSRGRDLEAQTSLKRGTLNLRHAQEAFGRVAREVARVRPADLAAGGSVATVGSAAIATYPANDADDAEGRFDPRM